MQFRSRGDRAWLTHAAIAHAEMPRLNDHRNAMRTQRRVDRVGDLRSQLLLHLQALRVDVNHAYEFRKPDDASIRDVRNMRLADERNHVMLTVTMNLNVLQ